MIEAKTKENCDQAVESAIAILRSGVKLPLLNLFVSWFHAKPDNNNNTYYDYTLHGLECCQSSNGIDAMVGMEEPSKTTVKGISPLKDGYVIIAAAAIAT
jgi:hypothetical protein